MRYVNKFLVFVGGYLDLKKCGVAHVVYDFKAPKGQPEIAL